MHTEIVHIYGVPFEVIWKGKLDLASPDAHVHLEGHCVKGTLKPEVLDMIASQLEQRPRDQGRTH